MDRKEQAYIYLKNAILTDQLLPDEPIPELAVARELKMSRTPIREAMRKLESEGLVVSYPSRGSFVTSLSPYDVEEIYELRSLLEIWALERSIMRISDEELNTVEECFEKAGQESNWEMFHEADRALHGLIVGKAGSRRLFEFINILYSQIERIRCISAKNRDRIQKSYREHMEIIRRIRERDVQKSKVALSVHLRSVTDSAVEAAKLGFK